MKGLFLLLFVFVASTSFADISCEDLLFYREQNRKFNEQFGQSSNKQSFEKWFLKSAKRPLQTSWQQLRSGAIVQIEQSGFEQPTKLVLNQVDKKRILFSTKDLDWSFEYSIANFAISKNDRFAAVALYKKGSIDHFIVVVVNIRTGKIFKNRIKSTLSDLFWINDSKLLISTETNGFRDTGIITFYSKTRVSRTSPKILRFEEGVGWAFLFQDDYPYHYILSQSGHQYATDLEMDFDGTQYIAGTLNRNLVVLETGTMHDNISFLKLPREKKGILQHDVVYRTHNRVIDNILMLDETNGLIAHTHWGADRWLTLLDTNGDLTEEIKAPNCCTVQAAEWSRDGEGLLVTLTSQFQQERAFIYNLKTKKWQDPQLEDRMLVYNGIQMKTNIVNVTSEDGKKIPMRMTYRADLERNRKNPVLIEVYGSSSDTNFIDPTFDKEKADFIRQGGILAGPAIRGGNEFGLEWSSSALYQDKILSMKDLIASEKWFSRSGWSNPSLIITTGASHGGFVVASAALMQPKALGLTIPSVGVYDIQNIRALDESYPPMSYPEYGEPEYSPTELAKTAQSSPKILLMAADSDSRVNPQHSWNFARALLENSKIKDNVNIVTLKNAGHWFESSGYQGIHSWRAKTIFWTTIYDHIGWKFTPEASSRDSQRKN